MEGYHSLLSQEGYHSLLSQERHATIVDNVDRDGALTLASPLSLPCVEVLCVGPYINGPTHVLTTQTCSRPTVMNGVDLRASLSVFFLSHRGKLFMK